MRLIAASILKELEAEGLPLDRFGDLDSGVNLARTESRSVLGFMNEMGGSASTRLPTPAAWVEPMPGS